MQEIYFCVPDYVLTNSGCRVAFSGRIYVLRHNSCRVRAVADRGGGREPYVKTPDLGNKLYNEKWARNTAAVD